jgi:hypothetical protein
MCTTNEKCVTANGFNPDAGAKYQPGDLVRIGNDKRIYPVLKCFADYAELDAGEGSVYNISLGYLTKLSESSAVGAILSGLVNKTPPTPNSGLGLLTIEQQTNGMRVANYGHFVVPNEVKVITKPPIGIIPRKFHEENRISDLMCAIEKYLSDGRSIPEEWVDELNELLYNRIDRKVEA